ncbi:TerC family protein [Corynebacterium otitidis]|uniref:Putative membrane protein n=1 Tax=Corynebacterium otitidis ATCC 51513 TaxID=883169 RepID=I7L8C7_9CORY|nr:TerC family protein [Corynebacterium otitidis]EJZ83006.1 TerC family integral membrane protein [Corynebacterium otitidis ATCC 51513]CCI83152.1 putative membrane protein [Corynebacterium otitidis ATCC 51513]
MTVPLWAWAVTIVIVGGFFVFDFYSHVRSPHDPTMKESAFWTVFYVGVAVLFGGGIWLAWDGEHAVQYFTGYITEQALSVDNLFVFALIMAAFKIPRRYQQKVLLIGIALALVFRTVFILIGAAIIEAWSDVFYLFAIFLVVTAVKMIVDEVRDAPQPEPKDMRLIKMLRKVFPVTDDYHEDKLLSRDSRGRRAVTPLLVALVGIGAIDLMFALDSIPAIYGITQEPFLVFATNAMALLGLRQLFFLLDGLLERLSLLSYGLAIILGYIGVKLALHAMHNNSLPFINDGEPLPVPEIPDLVSLGVVAGILAVTVVASLVKTRLEARRDERSAAAGSKS